MNHEIPTTCPNCGHEYDALMHWLVCPQCGHETSRLRDPSQPVSDLNLSTRTLNSFRQNDVTTVAELVSKTPQQLLSYRSFGQKCLQEVREALAKEGLELKNDFYSVNLY